MRMRRHHYQQEEDTGIDLTPMLDVVFIMLIFFIVTSSFIKESGVEVQRPQADTASTQDKGNILIAVTADGQVWIDKQAVDVQRPRPCRADAGGSARGRGGCPGRPGCPHRPCGAGDGPGAPGRRAGRGAGCQHGVALMQPRLVRFSLAFVAACVVALLLFALMLSMVNPPRSKIQEDPLAIANFVRMDGRNEDSATRTRQQAPQPPQPKTPQPPTPPTPNMATPDANLPKLDLDLPSIDAGISVATAPAPSLSGLTAAQSAPAAAPAPASAAVEAAGKPGGPEQEVMPLNDVRPEYPYRARQQGIEGHIKLAFTINPQGRVENIRVLEASPRNVFDREARVPRPAGVPRAPRTVRRYPEKPLKPCTSACKENAEMLRLLLVLTLSLAASVQAAQAIDPAVFMALERAQTAQSKGDYAAARRRWTARAPSRGATKRLCSGAAEAIWPGPKATTGRRWSGWTRPWPAASWTSNCWPASASIWHA